MVWVIVILFIVIISFVLALRSMRSYKEIPTTKFPYALYLIKNEELFLSNGMLNKLYEFCQEANTIVSLERLFKGSEKALILFAPPAVAQFIPDLELLEIEDYIDAGRKNHQKKVSVDEVIVWAIDSKDEEKMTVKSDFLHQLGLEDTQQFFWQIVMTAAKQAYHFHVNIRAVVVEMDIHKRVELAKRVENYIGEFATLSKKDMKQQSVTMLVDEYKKRVINPIEAEGFVLSSQTLKQLL